MLSVAAVLAVPAATAAQTHLPSTPQAAGPPPHFVMTDGAIQLSVEDAVAIALTNNLSLVIERFSRSQAEHSIFANLGIYDTRLFAAAGYADTQQATASELDASKFKAANLNLGLSQLFASGGDLTLGYDNTRTETNLGFPQLNPAYDSKALARLLHPMP